jgi:hypothetical protein
VKTPASESYNFGDFSTANSDTIFTERQLQLLEKTFPGSLSITLSRIYTATCRSGNFELLWKGLCQFLHGNELAASRTIRKALKRRQSKENQTEVLYDDV